MSSTSSARGSFSASNKALELLSGRGRRRRPSGPSRDRLEGGEGGFLATTSLWPNFLRRRAPGHGLPRAGGCVSRCWEIDLGPARPCHLPLVWSSAGQTARTRLRPRSISRPKKVRWQASAGAGEERDREREAARAFAGFAPPAAFEVQIEAAGWRIGVAPPPAARRVDALGEALRRLAISQSVRSSRRRVLLPERMMSRATVRTARLAASSCGVTFSPALA